MKSVKCYVGPFNLLSALFPLWDLPLRAPLLLNARSRSTQTLCSPRSALIT